MKRPLQKRALATRSKLIGAATKLIAIDGFSALRVEQVVQEAGVAKGTFFTHFHDKDALMDIIIGAKINEHLDEADGLRVPENVDTLVEHLMPLMRFMTCDRYVFDLIIRHSGAAAKQEIGPIARTFDRQVELVTRWLSASHFRTDRPAMLLAEGTQAFMVQCMGLNFCAISCEMPMEARLFTYLDAWLCPKVA